MKILSWNIVSFRSFIKKDNIIGNKKSKNNTFENYLSENNFDIVCLQELKLNENNTDIFVEGDNKAFRLIAELKNLFDFTKKIMLEKNELAECIEKGRLDSNGNVPSVRHYTDIMKYIPYCFKEN